jgi:hypothetical protein
MQCVQCQAESGVELVAKLLVDWADAREQVFDEWLRCRHCGATYYGVLTDTFFSDDFRIEHFTADPQSWQESYARARACPRPDDHECKCPAHTQPRSGRGKLLKDEYVIYHD